MCIWNDFFFTILACSYLNFHNNSFVSIQYTCTLNVHIYCRNLIPSISNLILIYYGVKGLFPGKMPAWISARAMLYRYAITAEYSSCLS